MEHEYRRLMAQITAPPEWSGRVLAAAEQSGRRKRRPAVWAAACGVLTLLVAGGLLLRPAARESGESMTGEKNLTAYAAALGMNGCVLLDAVEGQELSALEGTTQTLSLVFADGQETVGTYFLRKERLKTAVREDGEEALVPVLAGDPAKTVEGIYAVPSEESRWLLWPVAGSTTVSLSNRYGYRVGPDGQRGAFHSGIDIPAESGTAVTAAASGTVIAAEFDTERGNYVILDHGDGLTTLYGHCRELLAETGDTVAEGDTIALVGATGMATGPHLHFEVRQDGAAQDPVAYFCAEIRSVLKME